MESSWVFFPRRLCTKLQEWTKCDYNFHYSVHAFLRHLVIKRIKCLAYLVLKSPSAELNWARRASTLAESQCCSIWSGDLGRPRSTMHSLTHCSKKESPPSSDRTTWQYLNIHNWAIPLNLPLLVRQMLSASNTSHNIHRLFVCSSLHIQNILIYPETLPSCVDALLRQWMSSSPSTVFLQNSYYYIWVKISLPLV